jgi:hypothetical protein
MHGLKRMKLINNRNMSEVLFTWFTGFVCLLLTTEPLTTKRFIASVFWPIVVTYLMAMVIKKGAS